MTHHEVFEKWLLQKPNRRGVVEHRGSRVFCESKKVYSFGKHYTLGFHLGDLVVLNGDRYSSTTGHHQSGLRSSARRQKIKHPIISYTAVQTALNIYDISFLGEENILDFSEATCIDLYCFEEEKNVPDRKLFTLNQNNGRYRLCDFKRPKQGALELRESSWQDKKALNYVDQEENQKVGNFSFYGYWHVLGGVLLEWKKSFYLCAVDEGRYFVSKLPHKVRTVAQAIESLKPRAVKLAETVGCSVLRQGEWFVVESNFSDDFMRKNILNLKTKKSFNTVSKMQPLPKQNSDSNNHVCKQVVDSNGQIWVKGVIFHRNARTNRATREHRSIYVKGWCPVYKNTEKASWSFGGRFD